MAPNVGGILPQAPLRINRLDKPPTLALPVQDSAPQTLPGKIAPTTEHLSQVYLVKPQSALQCLHKGFSPTSSPSNTETTQRAIAPANQSNQGLSRGIDHRIKQALGSLFFRRLNSSFIIKAQIHAEYMSQGPLDHGKSPEYALTKSINLLKKMEQTPEIDKLIKSLEYAKKIDATPLLSKHKLPDEIKQDLRNLTANESLCIPVLTIPPHATLMQVTRKEDGSFIVVMHNTGDGIQKFHHRQLDDKGKLSYQTALEITGVTEENLCGPESTFLKKALNIELTEVFYSAVLPLLKGKISEANPENRLWNKGQYGGTCAISCIQAYIRSQLDKDSFKQLRRIGREDLVTRSFEQIESGWGDHSTQRIVTLEVVKKLEQSLKGQPLRDNIRNVKEKLEAMENVNLDETSVTPKETFSENMKASLKILRKGKFSEQSMLKVRPYLDKILEMADKEGMTESETKEVIKMGNMLREYAEKRPLSKSQIFMMAFFTGAIAKSLSKKDYNNLNIDPLLLFIKRIENRYNGLLLGTFSTHEELAQYKKIIEDRQRLTFTESNYPKESPGLTKLKEDMRKARQVPA